MVLRRKLVMLFLGGLCSLMMLVACSSTSPSSQPVAHQNKVINPVLLQGSSICDWPMFGYDPGHTGYVDASVQKHRVQGKLVWSQKFGPVFSSPVAGMGMLFIGSTDGYLYALREDTGAMVWRVLLHDNLTDSTPTLEGQVLFVAMHSTALAALDAHTGQVYWQFETSEKIQAPPLAIAGRVYLASRTTAWAFDASSGKPLWKFHRGVEGWPTTGSPTFAGNTLYIALGSGTQLWALNATNGQIAWFFDTGDRITSTTLVAANTVYIATWHGVIYALNRVTGKKLWSIALNTTQHQTVVDGVGGSMALANARLYVGDYRGTLLCLDALKGRVMWRYATSTQILATPVLASNQVYVGSGDGYFYALDTSTGRPIWRYAVGEVRGSASLANGHIYIGSLNGTIYAFA